MKPLSEGGPLNAANFEDFITRLHHHCVGEGVDWHCTADAIFQVEKKVYRYGISADYTDIVAVYDGANCLVWRSYDEFYNALDDEEKIEINTIAIEQDGVEFLNLSDSAKETAIEEYGLDVTGWDEDWEYVCSHFTKEAAEAWIARKGHDYPDGLRVYVNAQLYCWEWNAIKQALLDGTLVLAEKKEIEA